MVNYQIVTVQEDIAYNEEYLKLKRERKLSSITNDLWRSHLQINKEGTPEEANQVEDELKLLAAKKALLLEKQRLLKQKESEEQNRYEVLE